jgi:rfaE bifunctional protein kinase chain/domain
MSERKKVERLVDVVRRFSGRRVAVLGDLVVDEFLHGDIARVSREAPVLILEHRRTVVVPGGGGNSVANLRALGAHPIPVGVVGRDGTGRRLLAEFQRAGVSRSGIRVLPDYETPSKSRVLAGGVHTRRQQIVRLDRGAARGELRAATRSALRSALERALKRADGLLVADYGYGAASPSGWAPLLSRLARGGLIVTVDSRANVARFRNVTACTPNQEELELALDETVDERSLDRLGRALLRRTGNDAVLLTRGARGMSLYRRGRPTSHLPAYGSDEVADVTGAGDTVIAVFTLALICGASFIDAARLSNYAAGLVVAKAGTATVTSDELIQAILEEDPS